MFQAFVSLLSGHTFYVYNRLMIEKVQYGLLWLAAKLHQGHVTGCRDTQNGWRLPGQPSCIMYEGHLESKERFAFKKYLLIIGKKKNMQVLSHTFTYFST